MKRIAISAITLLLVAAQGIAAAGSVTFHQDSDGGNYWMDVFLTPSPGSEFTNFDIVVTPWVGGLLDPVRNQPAYADAYDDVTDGARIDTWANTPFSSLGAGAPYYVFTEYRPGGPPIGAPPDAIPTVGGWPDQLNWTVFDLNRGDTDADAPYHIARFLYTPGGFGTVSIWTFDTVTVGIGETFVAFYGIPEPASAVLGGLALLGCIVLRRRR